MITIVVNGEALQVPEGSSVLAVLQLIEESRSFNLSNMAVALNQNIVPKSQWSEKICEQDDNVDLFNAVAGG